MMHPVLRLVNIAEDSRVKEHESQSWMPWGFEWLMMQDAKMGAAQAEHQSMLATRLRWKWTHPYIVSNK